MKNKYKHLFLFIAVAITMNTTAQTTFTQNWYTQSGNATPVQSAVTFDDMGGTYVTGATKNAQGNYDIIVTKYNSGALVWQYIFAGTYAGDDIATAIWVDNSTYNVYLTGTTWGGVDEMNNIITISLNANGGVNWMNNYDGNGLPDAGADIRLYNNKVYVTASICKLKFGLINSDFALLEYDPYSVGGGGALTNLALQDFGLNDIAVKLNADASLNEFFISGISQTSSTDWGLSALEVGPPTSIYNNYISSSLGTGADKLSMAATDNAGNIYIVGGILNAQGNYDMRTIKLDASLTLQWSIDYAGLAGGDDLGNDIKVDANGNVYVCGYTTVAGQGKNYLVLNYDTYGNQIWQASENGIGNGDDEAKALCLDASGNVFVTGSAKNSTDVDYYTVNYSYCGIKTGDIYFDGGTNTEDVATTIYMMDNTTLVVSGAVNINARNYGTVVYNISASCEIKPCPTYIGFSTTHLGNDISAVYEIHENSANGISTIEMEYFVNGNSNNCPFTVYTKQSNTNCTNCPVARLSPVYYNSNSLTPPPADYYFEPNKFSTKASYVNKNVITGSFTQATDKFPKMIATGVTFVGVKVANFEMGSQLSMLLDPNLSTCIVNIIGDGILGIEKLAKKYAASISPNIIDEIAMVSVNESMKIEICSINGEIVKTMILFDGSNELYINDIASGIYNVRFIARNGDTFSYRIIKN